MTQTLPDPSEPPDAKAKPVSQNWERDTLEKVLMASIEEQRRSRRWGIVFKSLLAVYVGGALLMAANPFKEMTEEGEYHTAVIDVAGVIAPGQPASADNIIDGLRDAVEDKKTKGILLRMNSPGGSPVQSSMVYDEIRRIKKQKSDLPVVAVVSDMCASGCYYVAAAADKIFVSNASVVGSIGVIMGGFGFVDAMKQWGVERRIMTAGEHKALLDPFAPVDGVAKDHMQKVLGQVHQQFIDAVKQGRGDRLKETPDMFSGLIWTGAESITLGLADDVGDDRSVAEKVLGAKTMVIFNPEENVLDRLTRRMGATMGNVMMDALVERLNILR